MKLLKFHPLNLCLLKIQLDKKATPFHHHIHFHGLIIPSKSIGVPKLPQIDTEETIKVNMTAFVTALLDFGEHKLRLLTSFFSTKVLYLIIE